MDNKEAGLVEIYERIKSQREVLGLVSFKRNPTKTIDQSMMPSVAMIEGVDNIVKRSDRSRTGYPARRVAEIELEIVAHKDIDLKALYRNVRRVVFMERNTDPAIYNPIVAENVFINENRTEGPSGFGLPDVTGMRLVLDLVYTDNGF